MATSFQYREITRFLDLSVGEEYKTVSQIAYKVNGVDTDDTASSIIKCLGGSIHQDFTKYYVRHECVKPYQVRFDNKFRDNVIVIEEFVLFVPKNRSYVWTNSTSRNCNELLKRIKASENANKREFNYKKRMVDLPNLTRGVLSHITGGHFTDLKIADVQGASLYGSNVGESEDWQRYESSGAVSAIYLNAEHRGQYRVVMLTKNSTVVIFPHLDEKNSLEVIEKINDLAGQFIKTN